MESAINKLFECFDGLFFEERVEIHDEDVWLTQKSMAQLFDCSTDNISFHLKNIFQRRIRCRSSYRGILGNCF